MPPAARRIHPHRRPDDQGQERGDRAQHLADDAGQQARQEGDAQHGPQPGPHQAGRPPHGPDRAEALDGDDRRHGHEQGHRQQPGQDAEEGANALDQVDEEPGDDEHPPPAARPPAGRPPATACRPGRRPRPPCSPPRRRRAGSAPWRPAPAGGRSPWPVLPVSSGGSVVDGSVARSNSPRPPSRSRWRKAAISWTGTMNAADTIMSVRNSAFSRLKAPSRMSAQRHRVQRQRSGAGPAALRLRRRSGSRAHGPIPCPAPAASSRPVPAPTPATRPRWRHPGGGPGGGCGWPHPGGPCGGGGCCGGPHPGQPRPARWAPWVPTPAGPPCRTTLRQPTLRQRRSPPVAAAPDQAGTSQVTLSDGRSTTIDWSRPCQAIAWASGSAGHLAAPPAEAGRLRVEHRPPPARRGTPMR